MTDRDSLDRRRFLAATGAGAAVLIAGCSSDSDGSDDNEDNGDNGDSDGNNDGSGDAPAAVDDFLGDANNYDGVVDETGSDEVTVSVGDGGSNAFAPAAVRISTGTTVTWKWDSDTHNVSAKDAPTDWSGHESIENTDFTYEHTFDEAGEYMYVCTPHEQTGMKGAIVVE